MDRFPGDTSRPMLDERALDLLFRDVRSHDGWLGQSVSEELLKEAVDLMKCGPTAVNASPPGIVPLRSAGCEGRAQGSTSPADLEKNMSAPVTAILEHDRSFLHNLLRLFPHADTKSWLVENETFAHDTAYRNGTLQVAYSLLAPGGRALQRDPLLIEHSN